MTEILGFLSFLFGPLMRIMYNFIGNYGLTMVLFTVLIRLVTLPLAIKQQKSMAKMSVFTPMINELQQKYKNDQEKLNEEMLKFQQEYGYNPMSGCLPMFLNLFVLFGIIQVVYYPLRYILGIPTETVAAACEAMGIANNYMAETQIIEAIQNGAGAAAAAVSAFSAEQMAAIQGFNTNFFGMNIAVTTGFTLTPLLVFPILSTATMFISQIVTNKMSGQQAQMQGGMKVFMWLMNLMFAYISFTLPICFSLYYTTSNLCMILQSVLTHTIYSPEKFKAQYEEELAAKRAAKKAKKEVVVVEKGEEVTKQVNEAELNRLRLERARALDAEKYKDERTRPLTEAELEEKQNPKGKRNKGGK